MIQLRERIDLRFPLVRLGVGDRIAEGAGLRLARDEGLESGIDGVRQERDSIEQTERGDDPTLPLLSTRLDLVDGVEQRGQGLEGVKFGVVAGRQGHGSGLNANGGADRGEAGAQGRRVTGEALGGRDPRRVEET